MTANIVLWLDLAEANQQDEASVREVVPPGAELVRYSEHGGEPCPDGQPARWPPVLDAIDDMLRDARTRERAQGAQGCRYWVTGRAALPAFFYVGHRLGKMAAITFVHQARNGNATATLSFDEPGPRDAGAPPYFSLSPWPIPRNESTAPVALIVSWQHAVDDVKITEALARRGKRPAAILRAHTPARLDRDNAALAQQELDALIRATAAGHPSRETLAVFIAGPTSLAFLAGNAIAPRVCRDVQIFGYDGAEYTLAYELPYPPVPESNVALWLGASPAEVKPLELEEESRDIQIALSQAGLASRLAVTAISVARPMDLYRELENRKPAIVQFSGHGHSAGLLFQDESGKPRPLLAPDLAEQFRLAGDTVRVVVLTACFSDSYADELLPHVDCLIVMRGTVGDTDARMFAKELYRSLAQGDSVQTAFDRARNVMRLERQSAGATIPATADAPRLRERYLGCASRLVLVKDRR
ncbi:MAG TPA: SAVED domain-containing protein [Kofleriaceae bacterium]|jgi:hypothetical protein|nr:SAVED domain-containing protein [Kofleriaceae bacterium]